jgi:hypothetical protein
MDGVERKQGEQEFFEEREGIFRKNLWPNFPLLRLVEPPFRMG